jgi:hypothetical protein
MTFFIAAALAAAFFVLNNLFIVGFLIYPHKFCFKKFDDGSLAQISSPGKSCAMMKLTFNQNRLKKSSLHNPDQLPPQYREAFYLQEQLGNNAFDYEARSQFHPNPEIRVAPLIESDNLDDLKPGQEISFEIVEDGKTKSFAGLKNFLLFRPAYTIQPTNLSGKPLILPDIYIFDNHNHAFYFWHFEKHLKRLHNQITLIHVDQHKDSRIPVQFLQPQEISDLDQVFRYTNHILNVGNFIPAAFKTGLLKEMLLVDSSDSLENFFSQNPSFDPSKNSRLPSFILDIDLDFFAPELDYIGNQAKLDLIRRLLPHAAVVTIASSPFFIDQNLAIEWCRKIFAS